MRLPRAEGIVGGVQGVPDGIGLVGAVLLALGLLVAVPYAFWMRRRLGRAFASAGGTGAAVASLLALALLVGVGATPLTLWRIVQDIRYTSSLDPWLAERYGVSVFEIHPSLYDRLLQRIPPDETYALRVSPGIDDVTRGAFEQWALTTLLPRRAVASTADTRWIVTLGIPPRASDSGRLRAWKLHPGGRGVPPSFLFERL